MVFLTRVWSWEWYNDTWKPLLASHLLWYYAPVCLVKPVFPSKEPACLTEVARSSRKNIVYFHVRPLAPEDR